MDLGPNKVPIEVIKEGALGETYFGDILVILESSTKNHGNNSIS